MAKGFNTTGTNTVSASWFSDHEEGPEKYHELGLGRGVNVTDPETWRNKSSFIVRRVIPENILMTNECGVNENYKKEVYSFEAQKQAIQFQLDEPTSRFKIGMDAHYSQSTTCTTLIAGKKIATRSISFKSGLNDIPLYTSMYILSLQASLDSLIESSERFFEMQLCSWILQRIQDRKFKNAKEPNPSSSKDGENPIMKLATELQEQLECSDPEEKKKKIEVVFKNLLQDCKDFLNNLGITHYVSSIKLGALCYSSKTIKSQQRVVKGGIEAGVEGVATGGISGLFGKGWIKKDEYEKHIGQYNAVLRDPTSGEAVIEFQIQPIADLVQSQFIQWTLRRAIKEYIELKMDKSEGPFLISCDVDKRPIYWMVKEAEKINVIMGTSSIKSASLFYIKPTENSSQPCDFTIMHYGDDENDRKILMHLADPHVKGRGFKSLLPYYVSTNTIWGFSDKPLELKMSVETSGAQFSLHDRVQSSFACFMCRSTPVSMSSWLEGELFYIKCSQHALKMDGYIAMKRTVYEQIVTSTETDEQPVEATNGETENHTAYQTVTVLGIKDPDEQGVGMLFRLHPKEYKKFLSEENSPAEQTEQHKQPPAETPDLLNPSLIRIPHIPLVYNPFTTPSSTLLDGLAHGTTELLTKPERVPVGMHTEIFPKPKPTPLVDTTAPESI